MHAYTYTVHVAVNICITQTSYFSPFHCDQALLECFGSNGSTGPEAVVAAERTAAVLTAKAGARDPSAIPSICRISAALQSAAGEILSWKWYFLFTCGVSKCSSTQLPLDFTEVGHKHRSVHLIQDHKIYGDSIIKLLYILQDSVYHMQSSNPLSWS